MNTEKGPPGSRDTTDNHRNAAAPDNRDGRHTGAEPSGVSGKVEVREITRAIGLVGQLGINMAACIVVGVITGKYLDLWLGTPPWLLLVFSLLGVGASFKTLYDFAMKKWMK